VAGLVTAGVVFGVLVAALAVFCLVLLVRGSRTRAAASMHLT
jgi:ABC-type multidrug transport system permease subunit